MSMERPPAMPTYCRDWLTGTRTREMTSEQRGAFHDLLMWAWISDPPCTIPDNEETLARLSGLGGRWRKVGGKVMACFEPVIGMPGRLRNRKQWKVWEDLRELRETRAEAGRNGGKKSGEVRANRKANSQANNEATDKANVEAKTNLAIAIASAEEEHPPVSPQPRSKRPRKKPRPEHYPITETTRKWYADSVAAGKADRGFDLELEASRMLNKYSELGKTSGDWDATFRNWILTETKWARERNNSHRPLDPACPEAHQRTAKPPEDLEISIKTNLDLEALSAGLSAGSRYNFCNPVKQIAHENGVLKLKVPNDYFADFWRQRAQEMGEKVEASLG